jgi:uncharacterized protein (TIGR03083 family)
MTAVPATAVASIPPITTAEAARLAATEYERMVEQLRSLDEHDWSQPTECPGWDVRAMAGHSLGMLTDFTSYRTLMRRMRAAGKGAKASGEEMVDVMTALQVADHAHHSTDGLVALAAMNGPRAARWRTSRNRLFRRMPMKQDVDGRVETWRMRYLLDTILTRDPWMHRIDIARATGRALVLTPEHDGRIVADVVAEWARRHGQPFTLTLTGPAGGEFVAGDGTGERITIDAVDFCRTLSGRASGDGLLGHPVPF